MSKKEANIIQSTEYRKYLNGISKQKLIELYTMMLRIRLVQLKIGELYHEDQMKTPVHLCIGQEAIPAGVCANLNINDYVFSNHRGHGHYLAKGGNLRAMIAELYNRETGCSRGRGGSMHLIDTSVGLLGSSSIVSGSIPIATGAALGAVLQKNCRVAVAFFGDAAVEEGVLYESVNFALLKKLPVIYVCENNFYAVCSPLSNRQAKDAIYQRFEGLGIPSYKIDGNNVLEVYQVAKKAINNAHDGNGPSFLECRTYRIKDHHGNTSGVEIGYRMQEEVDYWIARCPLKNFEVFLIEQKILTVKEIQDFESTLNKEIAEAFSFAQESPLPDANKVQEYLFG